jgi:hypothetical protein
MSCGYVWVEKYRPTEFDNIVLDPLNKQILKNIIDKSYYSHIIDNVVFVLNKR